MSVLINFYAVLAIEILNDNKAACIEPAYSIKLALSQFVWAALTITIITLLFIHYYCHFYNCHNCLLLLLLLLSLIAIVCVRNDEKSN